VTSLPSLGPRGEGWVVAQLALLAVLAGAVRRGPRWSGALRAASIGPGVVAFVAGAALVLRGARDLGPSLTPLPRPAEDARLVDAGVYGVVRHPIYGGVILGSAGLGLIAASPGALAVAGLIACFFSLKAAREEEWLSERFPGYADYRCRTRRFIPGVW
jgi:protein-S-isoprenylcysteine O-methyltransferase Ste14